MVPVCIIVSQKFHLKKYCWVLIAENHFGMQVRRLFLSGVFFVVVFGLCVGKVYKLTRKNCIREQKSNRYS